MSGKISELTPLEALSGGELVEVSQPTGDGGWRSRRVVVDLLKGIRGDDGRPGMSAFEVAQELGFTGTEEEWLASLKGEVGEKGADGPPGQSAYEIAQVYGFEGTEEEWLESLQGEPGTTVFEELDGLDITNPKEGDLIQFRDGVWRRVSEAELVAKLPKPQAFDVRCILTGEGSVLVGGEGDVLTIDLDDGVQ